MGVGVGVVVIKGRGLSRYLNVGRFLEYPLQFQFVVFALFCFQVIFLFTYVKESLLTLSEAYSF